jgi:hypothetical protein
MWRGKESGCFRAPARWRIAPPDGLPHAPSAHVMNALRQALLPESPSLRPLFGRHSWLGTGAAVAANSCPEMLIRGQGQALRHIDRTLPTHVVRERRQDHHGKSTNTDQSL